MKRIADFFRRTFLWILLLPWALTFLGAASNQAVLIANHDKFPVLMNDTKAAIFALDIESDELPPTIYISVVHDRMLDKTHCLMSSQTHLNALADIFDLGAIYSVGDFLLMLGDWLWSFCPFVWLALAIKGLK